MGMACADETSTKAKAAAVSLIISFLPLAIAAEAANVGALAGRNRAPQGPHLEKLMHGGLGIIPAARLTVIISSGQ